MNIEKEIGENDFVFSTAETLDSKTGLRLLILKGDNIRSKEKSMQLAIAPEYGSNLLEFKVGNIDIFRNDKDALKNGMWTGCFVLWPLPNRYEIEGRKEYVFQDKVVSLEDINRKEGNRPLIHGLVDDQTWQYETPQASNDGARLRTFIDITKDSPLFAHFPYESRLTLDYFLDSSGVDISYTVDNNGQSELPYSFALHPYYNLIDGRDDTLVSIPASSVMEATSDLLPTGKLILVEGTDFDLRKPKSVKGLRFDDVWTNLIPGKDAFVEYRNSGLRIRHKVTPDFTHVVLFTQKEEEKGFICLEPQTGSTNAINLYQMAEVKDDDNLKKAAHLMIVPPGSSQKGEIKFLVEHLHNDE